MHAPANHRKREGPGPFLLYPLLPLNGNEGGVTAGGGTGATAARWRLVDGDGRVLQEMDYGNGGSEGAMGALVRSGSDGDGGEEGCD